MLYSESLPWIIRIQPRRRYHLLVLVNLQSIDRPERVAESRRVIIDDCTENRDTVNSNLADACPKDPRTRLTIATGSGTSQGVVDAWIAGPVSLECGGNAHKSVEVRTHTCDGESETRLTQKVRSKTMVWSVK